MFDYIGASQAGLAWVAWRRSDAAGSPTESLTEAERCGQLALEAWQKHPAVYPLYWQALWPLLAVALAQARLADAILHAQKLCAPEQQVLPASLAVLLAAALAAWEDSQFGEAQDHLRRAVALAVQTNFS
jgi:hypothetical protein